MPSLPTEVERQSRQGWLWVAAQIIINLNIFYLFIIVNLNHLTRGRLLIHPVI